MQDVEPGDILTFRTNPKVVSIRDSVLADQDFVRRTVASIVENRGVPLETLRAAVV